MVDQLDKEQLRVLRRAFDAFDSDKEGFILSEDVGTILELLGAKVDEKSLKKVVKDYDRSTGKLDFTNFATLAIRFVEIEVEEDFEAVTKELKEAFRLYDREGLGYITVKVFRDILHELDDKLSPEDLDMMIDEIDADGSGTVDFQEFMDVMRG